MTRTKPLRLLSLASAGYGHFDPAFTQVATGENTLSIADSGIGMAKQGTCREESASGPGVAETRRGRVARQPDLLMCPGPGN